MLSRQVRWTNELAGAVLSIAKDKSPQPGREELAADIRSRARELLMLADGDALAAHETAFVQALRSRLADPYVSFEAAPAFEREWAAAYQQAR